MDYSVFECKERVPNQFRPCFTHKQNVCLKLTVDFKSVTGLQVPWGHFTQHWKHVQKVLQSHVSFSIFWENLRDPLPERIVLHTTHTFWNTILWKNRDRKLLILIIWIHNISFICFRAILHLTVIFRDRVWDGLSIHILLIHRKFPSRHFFLCV